VQALPFGQPEGDADNASAIAALRKVRNADARTHNPGLAGGSVSQELGDVAGAESAGGYHGIRAIRYALQQLTASGYEEVP
jgi:hypothetical protein